MLKFATFRVQSAVLVPRDASAETLRAIARRHQFDYEPRAGFLYVRCRAISSRTNDNYDEFPAEEIKQGYKTFVGKPVFVNHNNDNHKRARGVCIDAVLHEDRLADGAPDTWAEVLMEVDAIRFPKLAQAILSGRVDRTSMGCDVAHSICSACGNKASTPAEYCLHIPRLKGKKILKRNASTGRQEQHLIRETCYGLKFFENSLLVEEPADPTALFLGVDDHSGLGKAASLQKEADWYYHRSQVSGDPIVHPAGSPAKRHLDVGDHVLFESGHSARIEAISPSLLRLEGHPTPQFRAPIEGDHSQSIFSSETTEQAGADVPAMTEQQKQYLDTNPTGPTKYSSVKPGQVHWCNHCGKTDSASNPWATTTGQCPSCGSRSIGNPEDPTPTFGEQAESLHGLEREVNEAGGPHAGWLLDSQPTGPSRYSLLQHFADFEDPENHPHVGDDPTKCERCGHEDVDHPHLYQTQNGLLRGCQVCTRVWKRGRDVYHHLHDPERYEILQRNTGGKPHYKAPKSWMGSDPIPDDLAEQMKGLVGDDASWLLGQQDQGPTKESLLRHFAVTEEPDELDDPEAHPHCDDYPEPHTWNEHFTRNKARGLDPWGNRIKQPYDGHGAFDCNNYDCTEHPQQMYEDGPGMPGWMQHDLQPKETKDLGREIGRHLHEAEPEGSWLLDQQQQGPSKYSLLQHFGGEVVPFTPRPVEKKTDTEPHLYDPVGEDGPCAQCGWGASLYHHNPDRVEYWHSPQRQENLARQKAQWDAEARGYGSLDPGTIRHIMDKGSEYCQHPAHRSGSENIYQPNPNATPATHLGGGGHPLCDEHRGAFDHLRPAQEILRRDDEARAQGKSSEERHQDHMADDRRRRRMRVVESGLADDWAKVPTDPLDTSQCVSRQDNPTWCLWHKADHLETDGEPRPDVDGHGKPIGPQPDPPRCDLCDGFHDSLHHYDQPDDYREDESVLNDLGKESLLRHFAEHDDRDRPDLVHLETHPGHPDSPTMCNRRGPQYQTHPDVSQVTCLDCLAEHEDEQPCTHPWCVRNEPEHTVKEHEMSPPAHLDPYSDESQEAEQKIRDALGDHPLGFLLEQNEREDGTNGPSKYSVLMRHFAGPDDLNYDVPEQTEDNYARHRMLRQHLIDHHGYSHREIEDSLDRLETKPGADPGKGETLMGRVNDLGKTFERMGNVSRLHQHEHGNDLTSPAGHHRGDDSLPQHDHSHPDDPFRVEMRDPSWYAWKGGETTGPDTQETSRVAPMNTYHKVDESSFIKGWLHPDRTDEHPNRLTKRTSDELDYDDPEENYHTRDDLHRYMNEDDLHRLEQCPHTYDEHHSARTYPDEGEVSQCKDCGQEIAYHATTRPSEIGRTHPKQYQHRAEEFHGREFGLHEPLKQSLNASDADKWVTCKQGHRHWGANGAAGLLIRHTDDDGTRRYLLQHRAPWVDHGGTWGVIGGAIGHDESPENGAVREAYEEMGNMPHGLTHVHTHTDDHGGWAYSTVVMDSPSRFGVSGGLDEETGTGGHDWFTGDQVNDLDLHPGFKKTWNSHLSKMAVGDEHVPCLHCGEPVEYRHSRNSLSGGDWTHVKPDNPDYESGQCETEWEYAEPNLDATKAPDYSHPDPFRPWALRHMAVGEIDHCQTCNQPITRVGPGNPVEWQHDAAAGGVGLPHHARPGGSPRPAADGEAPRGAAGAGEAAGGCPGGVCGIAPMGVSHHHAAEGVCPECGKPDDHIHLDQHTQDFYRQMYEQGRMREQMHQHADKRVVNLADPHDLKQHMYESHDFYDEDFWRNSHPDDHPALGPAGDLDRPLTHMEIRALHDHDHESGEYQGNTLGNSHFHEAVRLTPIPEPISGQGDCPDCEGTGHEINTSPDGTQHMYDCTFCGGTGKNNVLDPMHGGASNCKNCDSSSLRYVVDPQTGSEQAQCRECGHTQGFGKEAAAWDPNILSKCDECGSGLHTTEEHEASSQDVPGLPSRGKYLPEPELGHWTLHDFAQHMIQHHGENSEDLRDILRGRREQAPHRNDLEHMRQEHLVQHDNADEHDEDELRGWGWDVGHGHGEDEGHHHGAVGDNTSKGLVRHTIPAEEIQEGDYLDIGGKTRVHKTLTRGDNVTLAWRHRGSKAPGVRYHQVGEQVHVWRKPEMKQGAKTTGGEVFHAELRGPDGEVRGGGPICQEHVQWLRDKIDAHGDGRWSLTFPSWKPVPGAVCRHSDHVDPPTPRPNLTLVRDVSKEATWIGDHMEEPTLFWRAPKTKRWEVHIHNWTPDRHLRENYGAKPHQYVSLLHADNKVDPHPDNAGRTDIANRGAWRVEDGRYMPNSWGEHAHGIPDHVHQQVRNALMEVNKHAENHADLYGGLAEHQDIRDDLARVPKDMESEQHAKRMFEDMVGQAKGCPKCEGSGKDWDGYDCQVCGGSGERRQASLHSTALLRHFAAQAKLPGGYLNEESNPQEYWAEPAGKAPYDPSEVLHGITSEKEEGHGPWHLTRHPQTRAYQVVDNDNRLVDSHGPSIGLAKYELHDHQAHTWATHHWVAYNQMHGHIPMWRTPESRVSPHQTAEPDTDDPEPGLSPRHHMGRGLYLPGTERAHRPGEDPETDGWRVDTQHVEFHQPAPPFAHTTEDPKIAEYKQRAREHPAPEVYPPKSVVHTQSREHGTTYRQIQHGEPGYDQPGAFHSPSSDDEWHGPYKVIKHPDTGKYHVVDNQNRVTGYGGRDGMNEQHVAEERRDYADGRQASKEKGRGLAESLWGGAMEALDPGGTDESRRTERHGEALNSLMHRYEGGDHHPLHPGKFGWDDHDEEGDEQGAPYYEVKDPAGSGFKARDYGGPYVEIHHEATGPVDSVHVAEENNRNHDVIRREPFGHEELHQELHHWAHGDPNPDPRYPDDIDPDTGRGHAPGPDYARADPDIERWQRRKGYRP